MSEVKMRDDELSEYEEPLECTSKHKEHEEAGARVVRGE